MARLRGTGARRPLLLLAHLDVVEASRQDWETDPFKLVEIDGHFRGRGVIDDKAMASIFVANLIGYVKEGFKPDRDIILALTADEELFDATHNGVRWLLQHHRGLIDAEFAINEGGGGTLRNGGPFRLSVQHAEKVYQTYQLEVTDRGGHSAAPRRDNPIYRLADALRRLAQLEFPPRLNAVTRAYFEAAAANERPPIAEAIRALLAGRTDPEALAPLADRPDLNAQMRTTCVATMLEAGHAENALPQAARATVNCRILPDELVAETERTLARAIADEKVKITATGTAVLSPPSLANPEVMRTIVRLRNEMWPGIPVIQTMSSGAHRQPLAAQCGDPGLRRLRPVQRSRQQRRAWTQRARHREGRAREQGIPVSAGEGPGRAAGRRASVGWAIRRFHARLRRAMGARTTRSFPVGKIAQRAFAHRNRSASDFAHPTAPAVTPPSRSAAARRARR